MELLTYLKLTLTTADNSGEVLSYKKSAANKPRILEKESLIQIGAAYILVESLKVGPKT
jgi:hypothetical protein